MSSEKRHAANDFEILSFVENGINSKVYDVVQKQRNRKFTMEVVPRQKSAPDDAQTSRLHRHSHYKSPSNFLTQLKYSFQTKTRKYFVLSHLDKDKSLLTLLDKKNTLGELESRFIISEIIVAIETLHEQGISYGNLTINDIYFDPRGHVMLKRIYNGQTYWTKNECYQCHEGNCTNQFHNGATTLDESCKSHDWNSIGQLLIHVITGKQMFCSTDGKSPDALSKNARDFVRLLLEDSINLENVKNHVLLKNTNWEEIKRREIDIPDSIKLFVLDASYKHLKKNSHPKNENNDSVFTDPTDNNDNDDDVVTSKVVVEGVRKQRSFKSDRVRSKSYNQSNEQQGDSITLKKKITRSISCSDRKEEKSPLDDSLNIQVSKEMKERKKSIEVYQQRLKEISSVLDKNQSIMKSIDNEKGDPNINISNISTTTHRGNNIQQHSTNNIQLRANSSQLTNSKLNTTSQTKTEYGEVLTDMKKIYSENDAIRTILSKYGLLKDEEDALHEHDKISPAENQGKIKPPVPERPVLRRPKKSLSAGNTPRNNSPQPGFDMGKKRTVSEEDLPQSQVTIEGSRKQRRKSRSSSRKNLPQIGVHEEKDEHLENPRGVKEDVQTIETNKTELSPEQGTGTNKLIDKLNGLSKSKTFYMKQGDASQPPKCSQMKRHQSDPITKPTVVVHSLKHKTSSEQSKSSNAPQSLLKVLRSATNQQNETECEGQTTVPSLTSNIVFVKQKSISCDSGLNEPVDDNIDDNDINRKYVERNDSGVGSLNENKYETKKQQNNEDLIRVWKPGNPDIDFLQQEDIKRRSHKEDCHDCGKENIKEPFPNTLDTLCKQCGKSRIERKEAVTELIETEVNYGEDLRILKEEFYTPIKKNSICTTDEISKLFLNLQELVDVNAKLCVSLQYGLEQCLSQDDSDYMHLAVGEVFLNNVEFFEAYELYCAKQTEALELLTYLQKKSDLLRIFLTVSSQENSKLRKMDLKSFLTMPVQRIMKYPLLLSRILKHTPKKNEDSKNLKEALLKVEEQITKINDISKGNNLQVTPRVKKSNSFSSLMQLDSTDSANVAKIVANLQDWKVEETKVLLQEEFEIIPQDLIGLITWDKSSFKKITYLRAILCVNGAPENYQEQIKERMRNERSKYVGREIKDAVVVLLKQKYMDKCQMYKDPIKLKDCVLSHNIQIPVAFELSERDKVIFTFVSRNSVTCDEWKTNIRFVIETCQLKWRQRRGGRSNIMIPNSTLIQE